MFFRVVQPCASTVGENSIEIIWLAGQNSGPLYISQGPDRFFVQLTRTKRDPNPFEHLALAARNRHQALFRVVQPCKGIPALIKLSRVLINLYPDQKNE